MQPSPLFNLPPGWMPYYYPTPPDTETQNKPAADTQNTPGTEIQNMDVDKTEDNTESTVKVPRSVWHALCMKLPGCVGKSAPPSQLSARTLTPPRTRPRDLSSTKPTPLP